MDIKGFDGSMGYQPADAYRNEMDRDARKVINYYDNTSNEYSGTSQYNLGYVDEFEDYEHYNIFSGQTQPSSGTDDGTAYAHSTSEVLDRSRFPMELPVKEEGGILDTIKDNLPLILIIGIGILVTLYFITFRED